MSSEFLTSIAVILGVEWGQGEFERDRDEVLARVVAFPRPLKTTTTIFHVGVEITAKKGMDTRFQSETGNQTYAKYCRHLEKRCLH